MIPNAKVCLYPHEPAEAVRVLSELDKRALILAGGTSTALVKDEGVDTLVDITRMGFDTIERVEGGWSIGCNVRMQQIAEHAGLAAVAGGMLADAAAAVGSRPIRNAVTLGGNLIQLYRWSDPPAALLALDARAHLFGPDGDRDLSMDELLARHPKQVLGPAELLVRIELPEVAGRAGGFVKLARTATDYSIVDAAACLDYDGDGVAAARVVVGGARGRPFRATDAEAILAGKKPTRGRLAKAAEAARAQTRAIPDTRTSADYRQRMAGVAVQRALARAVHAHGKESS